MSVAQLNMSDIASRNSLSSITSSLGNTPTRGRQSRGIRYRVCTPNTSLYSPVGALPCSSGTLLPQDQDERTPTPQCGGGAVGCSSSSYYGHSYGLGYTYGSGRGAGAFVPFSAEWSAPAGPQREGPLQESAGRMSALPYRWRNTSCGSYHSSATSMSRLHLSRKDDHIPVASPERDRGREGREPLYHCSSLQDIMSAGSGGSGSFFHATGYYGGSGGGGGDSSSCGNNFSPPATSLSSGFAYGPGGCEAEAAVCYDFDDPDCPWAEEDEEVPEPRRKELEVSSCTPESLGETIRAVSFPLRASPPSEPRSSAFTRRLPMHPLLTADLSVRVQAPPALRRASSASDGHNGNSTGSTLLGGSDTSSACGCGGRSPSSRHRRSVGGRPLEPLDFDKWVNDTRIQTLSSESLVLQRGNGL